MKNTVVSDVVLGWPLQAEAEALGGDWLIHITGGCAPHIGSVSTAWKNDGAVAVQTVCVPGHRDNAVSERFARALADHLDAVVCVTCGIHYDGIDRSGIDAVLSTADDLLQRLIAALD